MQLLDDGPKVDGTDDEVVEWAVRVVVGALHG